MDYGKGMVKKWLCLAMFMGVLLLLLTPAAMAQEIIPLNFLKDLPTLKAGSFYNLDDSKWQPAFTTTVYEKYGINWDVGYIHDDSALFALTYSLTKNGLPENIPLSKYLDINIGYGLSLKRLGASNEISQGLVANIVKIKW